MFTDNLQCSKPLLKEARDKGLPRSQTTHIYTATTRQRRSLLLGIFPLAALNNNEKDQADHVYGKPLKVFHATHKFQKLQETDLNSLHQQESESIADLHTILTVLPVKCKYSQDCMNTRKVDLFIHAIKNLAIRSWARE